MKGYLGLDQEPLVLGGSNEELESKLLAVNAQVRLQCNLIAECIDNFDGIVSYLEWARSIGQNCVAFAQLTPLPTDDIYQPQIISYVSERQVDWDTILEAVSNDPNFVFEKYRGGVACYYEVWKYKKKTTVLLKMSDNTWLVKADLIPDLIPDLIIHTDGRLCASWDRNQKVILN